MKRSVIHWLSLFLAIGMGLQNVLAEGDDMLAKVKEAIQKAEAEHAALPKKERGKSGEYTDAAMKNILTAIEAYFAAPARRVLVARLDFEPSYGEQTVVTDRAAKRGTHFIPIGDQREIVKVEKKSGKPKSYSIKDGDVESLRRIESVVFGLKQAFKDTPLEHSAVRRAWPAFKNIDSLMTELPKFAKRYLDMDGMGAARYDDRLAEVDALRKQLAAVYEEWGQQMADLKKGDAKKP